MADPVSLWPAGETPPTRNAPRSAAPAARRRGQVLTQSEKTPHVAPQGTQVPMAGVRRPRADGVMPEQADDNLILPNAAAADDAPPMHRCLRSVSASRGVGVKLMFGLSSKFQVKNECPMQLYGINFPLGALTSAKGPRAGPD